MLGKTAGGLFWMFRYLERSENITRLLSAALRITLTRSATTTNEWVSVAAMTSIRDSYEQRHEYYSSANVVDFLLRDHSNPTSVLNIIESARNNARSVRTALTREVWEATNECWIQLNESLQRPVHEKRLPLVLDEIRKQNGMVRAALHGTMLRNDIYNFSRIGTFIERADNTARILDVKYHVLLPTFSHLASSLANIQWETILQSVSALRAYRWLNGADINPTEIANFLMLDERMPRSLIFCLNKVSSNLGHLERSYEESHTCHDLCNELQSHLQNNSVSEIQDYGLHQFIDEFIGGLGALSKQVEVDYRFYE